MWHPIDQISLWYLIPHSLWWHHSLAHQKNLLFLSSIWSEHPNTKLQSGSTVIPVQSAGSLTRWRKMVHPIMWHLGEVENQFWMHGMSVELNGRCLAAVPVTLLMPGETLIFIVMSPPSARHSTRLGCMVGCAGKSPISSQSMFASEKSGRSSSQNGRVINGAAYGSLMSRSTIFLAQMGRNIVGEGLGKNFCQEILFQQWRGVVAKSMCGA